MTNDHDDNLPDLKFCQAALVADLARVAVRDRWGRALMLVGGLHLVYFGVCQAIYVPIARSDPRYVVLWFLEVATVIGVLRLALGVRWFRATPMAGVVARIWGTFFVLALNLATYNSLTGWTLDWFKLGWATLSTFGFATMAWLLTPRFLVNAVQMWLTGLLIIQYPHWSYLIYGVSWCLALQGIGLTLERRRLWEAVGHLEPAEACFESKTVGAGA